MKNLISKFYLTYNDPIRIIDIASFCYINYSELTGLPKENRDIEGHFPEEIEEFLELINIEEDQNWDLFDFSEAWSIFAG